ncbi:MAG: hypothetical protein K5776_04320 [Lachnospiraceae bacterium]|nr:hypothetical protein [Lachnospiraceae bacterium]
MTTFLLFIFGFIIVLLIIELLAAGLSFLSGVYKIIIKCLIISKGGDDGWKGLIPFYGNYVYYHLGFNHKTSVILFVADTVLFVSLTIINFMFQITYNFYDQAFSQTSSYTSSTTSFNNLLQSVSSPSLGGGETTLAIVLTILSLILGFVSILSWVIKSIKNFAVTHAFGMETGFCVCSIFFPIITNSILAFSSTAQHEDYAVYEWFPD